MRASRWSDDGQWKEREDGALVAGDGESGWRRWECCRECRDDRCRPLRGRRGAATIAASEPEREPDPREPDPPEPDPIDESRARDLLARQYLDEALSPQDEADLSRHLRACGRCRSRYHGLTEIEHEAGHHAAAARRLGRLREALDGYEEIDGTLPGEEVKQAA